MSELSIGRELCDTANYASPLAFVCAKNEWLSMPHSEELTRLSKELFDSFYHDGSKEQIARFKAALKAFKKGLAKADRDPRGSSRKPRDEFKSSEKA